VPRGQRGRSKSQIDRIKFLPYSADGLKFLPYSADGQGRSRIRSRRRWSWSKSNCLTTTASALSRSGAWTDPRYSPRLRMIMTDWRVFGIGTSGLAARISQPASVGTSDQLSLLQQTRVAADAGISLSILLLSRSMHFLDSQRSVTGLTHLSRFDPA
jgi:hypothetical protein